MPEPPSIHRNSSRICNLTKRYFSRPTTFSSVFFLYDEIPEMPHTVTLEAAFQFWRVVSVDSQHQHEQRSHPQNYGQGKCHPQNYGQGKLLVRFRGKYFLIIEENVGVKTSKVTHITAFTVGLSEMPKIFIFIFITA